MIQRGMGLAVAAVMLLAGALSAAAPVRVLLITGASDFPAHDWKLTAPFLKNLLERTGRFDVKVTEEPRGLSASALGGYDLLVINYNGPRWGAVAEQAVEEFVRAGKGVVTFHLDSYSFNDLERAGNKWVKTTRPGAAWEAFADLVGAFWTPEGLTRAHSPRRDFAVDLTDREHPITRGLPASLVVTDELYNGLTLKPGAHLLAEAFDDPKARGTGQRHPMAWAVAFGRGRAFHTTLGHDLGAMYCPGFLALFARGAEWAATGSVTLPARISLDPAGRDAVRLLVVTGGHTYPASFYSLFDGDDIRWTHAASQREAFRAPIKDKYDVVLLHDMAEELAEQEQKNLREFVEAGKGVVSTHHAIVDYTAWPWWWEEVIGGKYFTKPLGEHPASKYKHDVEMIVRPSAGRAGHPVLRGVGVMRIEDEAYQGMWNSPRITVLMETDHPENDRPVVYLGPNPQYKAIYIQLGHGSEAHRHPAYRRLVRNAILWAAGRL